MPKTGDVIQNYQGRFAKVVSVKGNRYGLTAWVTKEADAKKETVAARYLNSYGMKQVLPAAPKKAAPKKAAHKKVETT